YLGRVLERIRHPQQYRLTPGAAIERDAVRQAEVEARRDRDVRVSRDRGELRAAGAAAPTTPAAREVDERRDPARGPEHRVELVLVHRGVDALGAGQLDALGARVEVGLVGERPAGLCGDERLLPEVRHLALLICRVEGNHVRERARLYGGGHR